MGAWALEDIEREMRAETADLMSILIPIGKQTTFAKQVPPVDLELAQVYLESWAAHSATPTVVSHTSCLPSNLPCEDTWSTDSFVYNDDQSKAWCAWAIFDGHAGPSTSEALGTYLPGAVGEALAAARCFERPYTPNDTYIVDTIKKVFIALDDEIVSQARGLLEGRVAGINANVVAIAARAHSGSCALFALYDPKKRVLRVANTGDSRAVIGRWDKDAGKYVAQPMSVDQTGFNPDEVLRLNQDHPGEEVVDPKTGRVHGIAVSRAFGDARWKWPQEVNRRAHEMFWGPTPRPDRMIRTPPYLTAEPEIMETRVNVGAHPDFLIMASDGLWDILSNEDAVSCVQLWLDKNKPTEFLKKAEDPDGLPSRDRILPPTFSSITDLNGDDETYFDAEEKCLKWRVSPKHFINEDEHCGIHLVRNALGGSRRGLFCSLMSLQPPLSRRVRDDITVHVIFFGQDTQDLLNN